MSSRRRHSTGPRTVPTGVEIGDLVGPVGSVDTKGTLRIDGEPWRLEWAVGAEDRWYVAVDEVAVRQELLDDAPVPVTSMWVRGGDVMHRVAGINNGSGRAISIEVENTTGTPVSLALVVRPDESYVIPALAIEGERIIIGDREVLMLDRPPGGTTASEADEVWPIVMAGPRNGDCALRSRAGTAAGAMVVPIPHGHTVRSLVPLGGPAPEWVAASSVAAGWRALAERAASVDVADSTVATEWRRGVPALILSAGTTELDRAAAAAPLLDRLGLPDEADRARRTLVVAVGDGLVRGRLAPAVATAMASRRLRAGRDSGLADLVAVLVAGGPTMAPGEVDLIADALDHEDPRAAADVRRLEAGPARTQATTGGLEATLDAVVCESAAGLDLLPGPQAGWLGHPIDVRGVSTMHGVVSYSVRWHGARPAILWDVETDRPLTVSCSGLDATWTTGAPNGEALLTAADT